MKVLVIHNGYECCEASAKVIEAANFMEAYVERKSDSGWKRFAREYIPKSKPLESTEWAHWFESSPNEEGPVTWHTCALPCDLEGVPLREPWEGHPFFKVHATDYLDSIRRMYLVDVSDVDLTDMAIVTAKGHMHSETLYVGLGKGATAREILIESRLFRFMSIEDWTQQVDKMMKNYELFQFFLQVHSLDGEEILPE